MYAITRNYCLRGHERRGSKIPFELQARYERKDGEMVREVKEGSEGEDDDAEERNRVRCSRENGTACLA